MAKQQTPNLKNGKLPKDKLLPKLTLAFFERPFITGLLWLTILVFGVFSYTTFLKREGFPSVNIPLTVVSGTYFVNDAAKVDSDVAAIVSDIALHQPGVKTVQTQSAGNFFVANVNFAEKTDAKSAADSLKKAVEDSKKVPAEAQLQYSVPYFGATGGDIVQIDAAVSFYDQSNSVPITDITAKAEAATKWLNDKHIPHVKSVFLKNPFENVTDPATGEAVSVQHNFDRYGIRSSDTTNFYHSVIIGIAAEKGSDVIKLDKEIRIALKELTRQPEYKGYSAEVSASFAPSIKDNISELQRVLLEGLLAILVVGSIVIAIRASIITVASMVTVLLATLGLLYLIGYTLNVITLFALILGLALIVDDTIIMVEAIDSARRSSKDRKEIVSRASRKISRAMVAATMTAALSFTPLLFVGGVLGSFIRAIPITLISALLISLFVALIFIPFMSRFLLLGKKQLGAEGVKEVAAKFEANLAHFIARPMKWARGSRKRLISVIVTAMFIGTVFLGAGLTIARNVIFNIFPPTKDTNGLILMVQFPSGTEIEQAEVIAEKADKLAADTLGQYFVESSYYDTGSAQSAQIQIQITPYAKRDVTSVQLVNQLKDRFSTGFKDAQVAVAQLDIGPPSAAFIVQLNAANRDGAFKLAADLQSYLRGAELKRVSGKVAKFTDVTISSPNAYLRTGEKSIVTVSAGFDGTDTTTLVTLAQDAVKKEFPESRMKDYGVDSQALSFDLGQETENQDSFKTLALAFPVLLIVMYFLLALQFKSFLQPLLIFMAIPFSIFGVMLGLDITHNAISFFSMLGFFALVGLSIKNTILLTDYANQARRAGMEPIDASIAALEERFRPLFATSMTAVVSLIPLALTSPFWEGLAVVLIFGLVSSTFLVITVFPYYYLGAEYARSKISARAFFAWLILTVIATAGVAKLGHPLYAVMVLPASLAVVILESFFDKRLQRTRK